GRYSLAEPGLIFAGGSMLFSRYQRYRPVADNALLITDEAYFDDDIVAHFVHFVSTVYGEANLETNLNFIADALGMRGHDSRECIRLYFVKHFYKDHLRIYKNRPIYWLFDSGRQDGFKLLISMHRWHPNTVAYVRVNYLHPLQQMYIAEIEQEEKLLKDRIQSKDKIKAERRRNRLLSQLKETQDYDLGMAHLSASDHPIDLDDGVKANYRMVQTAGDGKVIKILASI
ncbi:MAG TPA: restriction endonuclease, partial [Clostridiaceae bacterium]|nr:restriction endonuclease [Clostridiaceae bacterium]